MSLLNQFRGRFKEAEKRDRVFINQLNLRSLNNLLWPLYIAFVCLNFLDVYSTLVAIDASSFFRELNPIASALFGLRFNGFLMATAFKYLPAIPLFYTVFASDSSGRHAFEIRLIKFTGLVALIASDILLVYVVGLNNIPELVRLGFIRA